MSIIGPCPVTASSTLTPRSVWNPAFNIFNGFTVTAGVWLINYSIRLNTSLPSTLTTYSTWIDNTTGNAGQYGMTLTSASTKCDTGTNSLFGSGSCVISTTVSKIINIFFYGEGTLSGTLSLSAGNNILTATRIA